MKVRRRALGGFYESGCRMQFIQAWNSGLTRACSAVAGFPWALSVIRFGHRAVTSEWVIACTVSATRFCTPSLRNSLAT